MQTPYPFLKDRQVVFLSSIDWDAAWQRHQALAAAFANAGAKVLFVENTGFRDPRLSDGGRIIRRLMNVLFAGGSSRKMHPRPKNLRLLAPLLFPPTNDLFRLLNHYWLVPALWRKIRRRGIEDAIVVAYIPSQTTLELLWKIQPRLTIFDVVDHFAAHPNPPHDLALTEERLLRASDIVFTTAPLLQELHEPRHPKVMRVHHGVAKEFFLPAPDKPRKHKRLCYYGTLREDLDYDALNLLAEAGFHVSLIGPAKDTVPPLHPAIERQGMVPVDRLLRFLSTQDALLFPYTQSEWNKGITPAKIYESFATGLPVIASRMPGLEPLKNLLYTANSRRDFVAIAGDLDRAETPQKIRARVEEARRHSQERQFERISREISSGLRNPRVGELEQPLNAALSLPTQTFLKGFSWVALYFSAAKAATLIAQMAAARILGPAQYGVANLILASSALLQILPMLGFPLALAHFGPAQETEHERKRLISTTLFSFSLWSAFCLLLLTATAARWSPWLGLDKTGRLLALALAFLTAAHLTASASMQGLTWFRKRGTAEAAYGFCTVLLLAALAALQPPTYKILIFSLAGALATAIAYSLYQLRGYLKPTFHSSRLWSIAPYTLVGALNVLAAAMIQAPGRICLFHFHSTHAAGVYSAYFTSTAQLSLALITMTWTVLLPLASRPKGQAAAWKHLRQRAPLIIGAGFLIFTLSAFAAITLIGLSYSLRPHWLLLFAGAAAAILTHGIFGALYAARGLGGLTTSAIGALLAGSGNLLSNLLLTPRWGVSGAALSLLLGYALGLTWYYIKLPSREPHPDK